MPVLSQPVQYYAGVSVFSAVSAVIDIDDERRTFQLSTIDAQGNRVETIYSAALSEVVVKGSGTRVRFTFNGQRKWVDFSMGASMIQGLGIAGQIAGGVMNRNSGVTQVVAALKAGGADVRYWSYAKRLGITWGIAGGVLVLIVVIALAVGLSSQ